MAKNSNRVGLKEGLLRVGGAQILATGVALIVASVAYQIALPHYHCDPNTWLCLASLAAAVDALVAAAIVFSASSFLALKLLRVAHWLLIGMLSVPLVLTTGWLLFYFTYKANGIPELFMYSTFGASLLLGPMVFWLIFNTAYRIPVKLALAVGAGCAWLAALSFVANAVTRLPV